MKHNQLKRGNFKNSNGMKFERYVIENQSDVDKFFEIFSIAIKFMKSNFETSLKDGMIIIATDLTVSGFPSYCFESNDLSHPSNFVRIELL